MVAAKIRIVLFPGRLGWARYKGSRPAGVVSPFALLERGLGWKESYTSQPTLAPPPPVEAPTPAPAQLRSQSGGTRRTDTKCEASPPTAPPRPPFLGSLPPSPFFKSCVTCMPFP